MPEVWMSPGMQRLSGGKAQVQVEGATIRQVVNNLDKEYPGIKDELCEDDDLNPAIAVVIDGETSNLGMLERVNEDSEIHFIPAMAGGSGR
jgi:molybdopterin synthase sulfur carrier subunit